MRVCLGRDALSAALRRRLRRGACRWRLRPLSSLTRGTSCSKTRPCPRTWCGHPPHTHSTHAPPSALCVACLKRVRTLVRRRRCDCGLPLPRRRPLRTRGLIGFLPPQEAMRDSFPAKRQTLLLSATMPARGPAAHLSIHGAQPPPPSARHLTPFSVRRSPLTAPPTLASPRPQKAVAVAARAWLRANPALVGEASAVFTQAPPGAEAGKEKEKAPEPTEAEAAAERCALCHDDKKRAVRPHSRCGVAARPG